MRRAAFAILGLLVLCPATASATAKRTAASKVSNCSSVRAHAVAVDAQAQVFVAANAIPTDVYYGCVCQGRLRIDPVAPVEN